MNQTELEKIFGARLVKLNTGASGIRAGVHCEVKAPSNMPGMPDMPDGSPCMDFIGSDNSVDRYNEVINQDGWQLENFRKNPVIPDCHDYSSIGKILGRAVAVQVVNGKLINRVEFAMDNPMGAMAYKMAKAGFIKSQSVGFIPLEWTNGNESGQPDRTYTKQELLEISLVAVPANPGATIGAALKSGALVKSDLTELYSFLKQFCGEEKPNPSGTGSASAGGIADAHLLQLARSLKSVLQK